MKLVGISGSVNKKGNNEQIIDYVLDIAKQKGAITSKILISENKINGCVVCNNCKKEKACSIKDDMQKVYPLLEDADAIIVSSPVYFGSVSSQLKALLDRTLMLRRNDFLLKDKVGAAIAVGGSRNGGQEKTVEQIHAWMHIHGMIVVGDNNHFGGIVHVPFEKDDAGMVTVKETVYKVMSMFED
ncbi:MAG: flavodoxin family protein [bacterium]|nr:flavodoxin family protein [bacterium]